VAYLSKGRSVGYVAIGRVLTGNLAKAIGAASYLATAADGASAPWGFGLDYDYDALARLDAVTGGEPYALDLAYTSVSALDTKGDLIYTYGGRPHAPTQVSDWTLDYDNNGNRTGLSASGVVTNYTYNAANHLTQVFTASGELTGAVHYVYDGDGALALRVRSECDYATYIGGRFEERGFPIDYGDGGWDCDAQFTSYYDAGGQAVALRTTYPDANNSWAITSTAHYLHRDYLGNLTEVTDADGVVEGRARYDAFGRLLENTIPATITTRLYTGSIYDPATGLYKIGARWYDPVTALWLTPDAIVPDVNNPIAWNGYAFNYNNPVNFVDPSGHFVESALDAIGFGLSLRDFWRKPSLGNAFWLALDAAGLALPFVTGAWVRHAGKVDDVGDTRRIIEIGSGGGENLLRIAEARPGSLVVGVDYANDAATLAKIRAAYSPYRNIEVVRANYLRAPFGTGQFDEVIAIAPGSVKDYVTDAAKTATNLVSAHGRFYVVTDLGAAPTAIQAIEQGLKSRGLRGQIVSGFRDVRDIARGLNPLGIPLESAFFSGYDEVWEIFVQLGP
jgi:RHS repeat-associated protein